MYNNNKNSSLKTVLFSFLLFLVDSVFYFPGRFLAFQTHPKKAENFVSVCNVWFPTSASSSSFVFSIPSLSDPRAKEAALMCTNRTTPFSERSIFTDNFLAALNALTPSIAWQRYNGTGNYSVYAFAQCMEDLSEWDCNVCFAQIKTQVLRCLPFQRGIRGGRVFFDGYYLRYDDYNFFNGSLSDEDRTVCGSKEFGGNQSVNEANAMELVRNLRVEAPKE